MSTSLVAGQEFARARQRSAIWSISNTLSVAATFFFLFPPYLQIRGGVLHVPFLVPLLFAGRFLWLALRGVSRLYVAVVTTFLAGYAWVLLTSIVNGVLDRSIQLAYLNGVLNALAAYGVVHLVWSLRRRQSGGASVDLISCIFAAGVAHAAIMLLAFFVPPFASVLYSVVLLGEKGQQFVDLVIRSPGLTSGGGDALSVMQAIALVFGIHRFVHDRAAMSPPKLMAYVVAFSVLSASIFLAARTGIAIAALGVVFIVARGMAGTAASLRFRKSLVIRSVVAATGLGLLLVAGYAALAASTYGRFLGRSLEPVFTYLETGRVATTSSDRILDTMYFLPDSDRQRLFGDGNFGRDAALPAIDSDVGYVRAIHGVGIVGTVLMYAPFVFMIPLAFRLRKIDADLALLLIFVAVATLLVNLKVFHFANMRESYKVLCMLIASLALLRSTGGIGRKPVIALAASPAESEHTR